MKQFIGVVHKDPGSAYGIHFPDLPGCFSASDELDDLMRSAMEAISLWAEDEALPSPRSIEAIRDASKEDLEEGAFLMSVPVISLSGRTVRANVTIDAGLLSGIDMVAKSRGLTRSSFLAQAARREIEGA